MSRQKQEPKYTTGANCIGVFVLMLRDGFYIKERDAIRAIRWAYRNIKKCAKEEG